MVNAAEIAKKQSDKNFEDLIVEIENCTREERIRMGCENTVDILNNISILCDNDSKKAVKNFMLFVLISTQLGCAGLEVVSDQKKEEISEFFESFKSLKESLLKKEEFFDYKRIDDDIYRSLVFNYLCGTMRPAFSPYPNILFKYMLLVACAESRNQHGIDAIRNLRSDYFDFVYKYNETGQMDFSSHMRW